MSAECLIDGLLANIPRIEARRTLMFHRAISMAFSPKDSGADVMRAAGVPEADTKYAEIEAWRAERSAEFQQKHGGM